MSDRSGILPNSPLLYTLASVRYATWSLLQNKIPEIHEHLRDELPLLQRLQVRLMSQNMGIPLPEATSEVWLMMASDRTYAMQLGPDQALFFSSKYQRFADFQVRLERCLAALFDHMKFMDVVATGVRYVDHIKPRTGERLEDYVIAGFLTPTVPSYRPVGGASHFTYSTDHSELRVRSIFSTDYLSVPSDMVGLLAAVHAEPGKPLTLDSLQQNEMLLDMDSVKAYPQPQRVKELKEIMETFDNLHKSANAFFRHEAVCTDFAFNVWRGEE
ncbi:TIGR04255 family protein [Ralstonia solanacearum]|uniref:TIGR04255 family protein n=1 Tax=Ralstonia solanacearum TaxID=305 RepID=UPI00057F0C3D|nr:TIGR04255 family protein [Ralstonia solanacearum]